MLTHIDDEIFVIVCQFFSLHFLVLFLTNYVDKYIILTKGLHFFDIPNITIGGGKDFGSSEYVTYARNS